MSKIFFLSVDSQDIDTNCNYEIGVAHFLEELKPFYLNHVKDNWQDLYDFDICALNTETLEYTSCRTPPEWEVEAERLGYRPVRTPVTDPLMLMYLEHTIGLATQRVNSRFNTEAIVPGRRIEWKRHKADT